MDLQHSLKRDIVGELCRLILPALESGCVPHGGREQGLQPPSRLSSERRIRLTGRDIPACPHDPAQRHE